MDLLGSVWFGSRIISPMQRSPRQLATWSIFLIEEIRSSGI